ncbi:FtsX-like permease family protein, partial [Anaerolineales bacterium HSG24]|nr:FtsX-like permease family protein [Anaerolineales bacterium HSG24]
ARDNYTEQELGIMPLTEGNWPTRNKLGILRGSDTYYDVYLGDKVEIRMNSRERARSFEVNGYLDSRYNQPLPLGGDTVFFTTRERYGEMTEDDNFNQFMVRTPFYTPEYATETANRIDRHFEKLDIDTGGAGPEQMRTMNPTRHFVQDIVDGILLLLAFIGLGITGLGLFLIYNTVNAILTQQISQIGVMKAIGARWWQVMWAYAALIFFYGVMALIISVPTAAVAGWLNAGMIVGIMNIDRGPFTLDLMAVVVQFCVAMLSPVLASFVPILKGIQITVREAIGSYGLTGATGLIERLLARNEGLPYTLVLIIGNTFRNLNRVLMTQITLVGSGMIFIMVMGVSASTDYTFSQEIYNIHTYDVTFTFDETERIEYIERETLAQPNVEAVEMWNVANARIRPAEQPKMLEDDQVTTLFGMPTHVQLYTPKLVAGRWLEPSDSYTVVLNERLASKIGVGIGDSVTFYHARRKESTWSVVGLIVDPLTLYSAYMPQSELGVETSNVNQADTVWVRGLDRDTESVNKLAQTLRQLYGEQGIDLASHTTFHHETIDGITEESRVAYGIIVTMLAIMAVVIAIVGGIGLSGVLSLSVMERQREIGVMRAIGASSTRVALIFIGEGLLMGLISWIIAAPLGIPLGYILTNLLGESMNQNISYLLSPTGMLVWLVIIVVLSIVASWLPARQATKLSVRESLAYQ